MLRKTSLASLGLTLGGILTLVGFIAYATGNATLNLAGFFYGIPLLLGGLALKASELKPIPFSFSGPGRPPDGGGRFCLQYSSRTPSFEAIGSGG